MKVCFVVMPFASIHRPAIGVSLLKSALNKMGVYSNVYYFNLKFAELMGVEFNDLIAENQRQPLVGEMIFSKSAFNKKESSLIGKQIERIFSIDRADYAARPSPPIMQKLIEIESHADSFIDDCSFEILRQKPDLVGFSSTFNQNCSSIALARAIKQKAPDIPIIFGGANCEGDMGMALLKSVPSIDFVCSGEGDISFVEFIKSFLVDKDFNKKIQGILTLHSTVFDVALTNPVMDVDSLPIPDFDDYFDSIGKSPIREDISNHLIMETSRGCWWGEKFQCTFCGLNGSTMKYRSKSVPRALDELEYLIQRYGKTEVYVVDNIMDLKYIEQLFPEITRRGIKDVKLFYETKSNISKSQLSIMKKGGVWAIQPGIESLSDSILKIMKKGVSALQNISLLKWCMEFGIKPFWNLIWGFPEEPIDEYYKIAELVPLLVHLSPPQSAGQISLDRFSPYFVEPKRYGLVNIRPAIAYNYIYPIREEDLYKIAYQFEFDYSDGRSPELYVDKLEQAISNWKRLWESREVPILNVVYLKGSAVIIDTRPCSTKTFQTLSKEESNVYHHCDTIQSFQSIFHRIQEDDKLITETYTKDLISVLIEKNLMIENRGRYLSLAVQVKEEWLKNNVRIFQKF